MTIKEIAEFVERNTTTVGRWVQKSGCESAMYKSAKATNWSPADFDETETILILQAGKLPAVVIKHLAEQVRLQSYAKNTSEPAPPDTVMMMKEMIAAMPGMIATAVVQAMQQAPQQLQIEAPLTHMSLVGFCKLNNVCTSKDADWLKNTGKTLSAICRVTEGYEIEKIADERWGSVNGYPIELLHRFFKA